MHEATLSVPYASVSQARLVQAAIEPEVGDIAGDRTHVSVGRTGSTLEIRLEASDPVALRAGHNTWTGFVTVAEQVVAAGPSVESEP